MHGRQSPFRQLHYTNGLSTTRSISSLASGVGHIVQAGRPRHQSVGRRKARLPTMGAAGAHSEARSPVGYVRSSSNAPAAPRSSSGRGGQEGCAASNRTSRNRSSASTSGNPVRRPAHFQTGRKGRGSCPPATWLRCACSAAILRRKTQRTSTETLGRRELNSTSSGGCGAATHADQTAPAIAWWSG